MICTCRYVQTDVCRSQSNNQQGKEVFAQALQGLLKLVDDQDSAETNLDTEHPQRLVIVMLFMMLTLT